MAVRGEVRREEVVDLLWRDVDEAKARNAFRQALHRLRTALGEDHVPQDRERLRLVPGDALTVDIEQFSRAVAAGRMDEAVQLYRGHFLEGVELGEPAFDLWADQERTRLQARFRQVLQDAASQAAAAGRWADAIARARRLTALVPFDPGAAHLAATTLVSAGRRLEALDFLRQFAARLRDEMGLELPEELGSLSARLERQRPDVPTPAVGSSTGGELSLPFVGREAELSQLMTLWRTTGEDAGALALIESTAGLGKSRLVRELVSHARSLGRVTVLNGRERVTGVPLPLGVFAEALRPLVRAAGVAGASRHLLAEAARLLPELRDNFDLPPVSDVEDEAARVRFFEGVAALVDSAAYEQPILLVLEDLHGITPSSLDLLSYLSVRLAGSAVMFVLTVRAPDAAPATLTRLRALADPGAGSSPHGPRALRCVLAPLSNADAARCAVEAGRQLGLPEATAARAGQRAGGSPAQLLALLRQAGAGEELAPHPVSVRDLVASRLQSLTSAQRRFFVVLALIGRPAQLRLAADSAHISQAAARESAAVLEHEGLLERLPDDSFVAAELAAHVALETAGAASRNFLAAWVAEALSADPRSHPAELARFYAMAGLGSPAFESARRAAYGALAVGAVAEAVQFLASARTFAAGPGQLAQIESLLTALGSGRQRIAALAEMPTAETREPAGGAIRADPLRWRERLFPNWRVLFGGAVATLVISASVLASREPAVAGRAPLVDTLVLVEGSRGGALRYVSGDLASGFSVSGRVEAPPADPPWLDSLSRPWSDAIAAPGGRRVALGRVTASGTDVFVVGSDRRDTSALIVGVGDARPLAWSPDGRWLLATTNARGAANGLSAGLVAHRVVGVPAARVLDAAPGHDIVEAAWSPDGARIAWVSRVGAGDERQLEVFVSSADGAHARNISRHPADDFHISWSSDGELLAFTSMRDGNAELYAMGVRENRLWRLTRDPAQDDRGVFSRNGRFIAFESTRGGSAGVWIMPGLGGDARRVDVGTEVAVDSWRGSRSRYVARVRVETGGPIAPGETALVRLAAIDQFNDSIGARDVEWAVLDTALAAVAPADSSADAETQRFVGKRGGLARLVGTAGRWRSDTAFVRIGGARVPLLRIDAGGGLREWHALGVPAPTAVTLGGRATIAINADRQWDSGILSRRTVPLLPGLVIETEVSAPMRTPGDPASAVTVALVAPEDEPVPTDAPQFLAYASVTWRADASRLVYLVGPETFSEFVTAATIDDGMRVRIVIEPDSTVSFAVNGRQRWRSALRIIDARREPRVNAWIGGRATGDRVRVAETSVSLAPVRLP